MSLLISSRFTATDLFYATVVVDEETRWGAMVGSFPAPSTSFVGRRRELADIAARLSSPACRLLTLVGPGGIGKTRLAMEAAQHAIYPDGVYFVSLQSLTSSEGILPGIDDSMPFSFQGPRDLKTWLLGYLYDRQALLVMDNFEHLPDGAAMLSDILDTAPGVTLLVTSRERLRLREEWVLEVPGLDMPESDTPDAPEDFSAVRHFMQSALKAGYAVRDSDMPFVIRICRLVDGCPLGIELAAAWTRSLTCQQISHELQSSLDLLEASFGNAEPRHRSLRAVLEPTWARLTQAEQDVFMRLSVFHGSFTPEAAARVAGATLRVLTGLVEKSLVKRPNGGRYTMQELMRRFGVEKLEASGMGRRTRDAHSAYYAGFLEQVWTRLNSSQPDEALAEMDAEQDNLRAAWDWMVRCGKVAEIEASVDSLWLYYRERGRQQDSEQILAQAAAHERRGAEKAAIRSAAAPPVLLVEPLTDREQEILQLIAAGLSNQAIADRLILSVGTVKWYTTQIYGKLGVGNRAQAVRNAQQMNLFA
jgi:predicted ATPase/DNA-binding CsgD family transcriptional regulator